MFFSGFLHSFISKKFVWVCVGSLLHKLACIMLLVVICLSGLPLVHKAEAVSVSISGVFTSDFTFTKSSSPYNLTSNIIIASGATLTIEPGVIVNMDYHRIYVNGTLIARGSNSEKIVFQTNSQNEFVNGEINFRSSSVDWNEQTGKGCIIENAFIDSIRISVNDASPKIAFNQINQTILIRGGSPIVTNNNFTNSPTSFDFSKEGFLNVISGIPLISYNTFVGNGSGYGIYGSADPIIIGNNISNFDVGIERHLGGFQITDNMITKCRVGILVLGSLATPIRRNLIDNNKEYGISGGTALIDANTITNNRIGIHNPDLGTRIQNNNILANSVNSITTATADIDASNNWWGTNEINAINQTIYDKKVDPLLGQVTFMPILTSVNQQAPEIPELLNPVPTFDPSANPTPSAATEPTPRYTPMPTVEPDRPKTGIDQSSPYYSINILVVAVAFPLVITWLIVLLGYSLKAKISRLKADIEG